MEVWALVFEDNQCELVDSSALISCDAGREYADAVAKNYQTYYPEGSKDYRKVILRKMQVNGLPSHLNVPRVMG